MSNPEQMKANNESISYSGQKLARPSSQDKVNSKVADQGKDSHIDKNDAKKSQGEGQRSQSVDPNKNQSNVSAVSQKEAVNHGCNNSTMKGLPENIQGIMTKTFGSTGVNIYPRDFEKTSFKDRIMLDEYFHRVGHTGFGRTTFGGFYRRW